MLGCGVCIPQELGIKIHWGVYLKIRIYGSIPEKDICKQIPLPPASFRKNLNLGCPPQG